jgi:hypothetical protein
MLFPPKVPGGQISRGRVILAKAALVDIQVGLAAVEPETGLLPLQDSSVASVDPSVTIRAGSATGWFNITTEPVLPGTRRTAIILAEAGNTKSVTLTVTS